MYVFKHLQLQRGHTDSPENLLECSFNGIRMYVQLGKVKLIIV